MLSDKLEEMKDYVQNIMGGFGVGSETEADDEETDPTLFIIVYCLGGHLEYASSCHSLIEAKKIIFELIASNELDEPGNDVVVIGIDPYTKATGVLYRVADALKEIEEEGKWKFPLFGLVVAREGVASSLPDSEKYQITARHRDLEGTEHYTVSHLTHGKLYEVTVEQIDAV